MAKKEVTLGDVFSRGILKENPVLMLLLGTCPTLAVSTTAMNGIGMGIAATVVLIVTNFLISLVRNLVSDKVRIPVYITIIAGMVTIIQLFIKAYVPALDKSLGIFIPLITVNCIILGRAEAFANKNRPLVAAIDGAGMGLGFTLAITVMASIREILGNGSWFGTPIPVLSENPFGIMKMPPGGFFVYGIMIAGTLGIIRRMEARAKNKARALSNARPVVAQAAIILDGDCADGGCGSCGASAACGMSEFRKQMKPQKIAVPETIRNNKGGNN